MLKLENVHIRRGDYVVADNIDLTLEQGKVYSVLGPNGTGKSSLMKTIFGEVAHVGDELLHEAASIMAELGISHLAHRDVMRLSGGQRQLVMFAQVMLRRPEILMLDEPVSALDMHHQLNLLERVVQYTHEHNLVTLMVLHDLSLAAQFSDGVILLGEGKVQAQGAPQDVLQADMIGRLYKVDIELLYDSKGLPVIRPMRQS